MATTDKGALRVIIYTSEHKLEADLRLLPGSRLTDALNVRSKDFFALTDVSLFDKYTGKLLHKVGFAALNRSEIAIIFPADEGDCASESEEHQGEKAWT